MITFTGEILDGKLRFLCSESYEKKINFAKRQAIAALIILNEKTNENFRLENGNTLTHV